MRNITKLSEASRTVYADASRIVHKGSCIVEAAFVTGQAGAADLKIYDGENANAEQKVHVKALTGTTEPWLPGRGTRFDFGIFLGINTAATRASITFFPVTEE